jgi:hypothetical protein
MQKHQQDVDPEVGRRCRHCRRVCASVRSRPPGGVLWHALSIEQVFVSCLSSFKGITWGFPRRSRMSLRETSSKSITKRPRPIDGYFSAPARRAFGKGVP